MPSRPPCGSRSPRSWPAGAAPRQPPPPPREYRVGTVPLSLPARVRPARSGLGGICLVYLAPSSNRSVPRLARGNRRRPSTRRQRPARYVDPRAGDAAMRWRSLAYCLMGNHSICRRDSHDESRHRDAAVARHVRPVLQRSARAGRPSLPGPVPCEPIESDVQLWVAATTSREPGRSRSLPRPGRLAVEQPRARGPQAVPDWLDHPRLVQFFASLGGDPRSATRATSTPRPTIKGQSL